MPIPESAETSYKRWRTYLYATRLSEGRKVLDVACGWGYGSYLLSLNAQAVMGFDIHEETIDYAASTFKRDNLQFKVGSAARIPIEGTEVFDLIVFFEATEHISNDEQHALMVEVKRLLKKDGLFVVSAANTSFCTRDFKAQEFKERLGRYFPHVRILPQKTTRESDMRTLGTDQRQVGGGRVDCTGSGIPATHEEKEILYALGLCSAEPKVDVDPSALTESNDRIAILLAQQLARLEITVRVREIRLADLESRLAAKDAKIADLESALAEKQAYIQRIHSGRGWRLLTRYFKLRERLLPQHTIRRLLTEKTLYVFLSAAHVLGRIGDKISRTPFYLRNLLFTCPSTILMVTHVRFYPPAAGNELRIFNLIKFLKRRGYQIAILVNPLGENAPLDPERRRKIHELVDYYEEIGDFDGHHISSTGSRPSIATEAILERWRHQEQAFCPDVVLWRTAELIRRFSPRVIIAEYIWTSSVLKLAPAGTLRVIDLIDMFSNKAKNVNRYGFDDPLATSADEERAFLNRADLAIAIQDTEAAAFRKLEPTCRVIVAGIDFDVAVLADFSERVVNPPVVLIVASNNPFNVRCVQEFIDQAWPTIREQVPRSILRVVGKVCHSLDSGGHGHGLELLPYAADLTEIYRQAAVVINPVYAGTGLKVKSVETLGHGQALVSWPEGVAGLPACGDAPYVVSRNWPEMAMQVVHILTDANLSRNLRANAREFALAHLSADVVYRELDAHFRICLPTRLRRVLGIGASRSQGAQ